MKYTNMTVTCPNCGKKHKIDGNTKGCGCDTLDCTMAITTVTFSLITGLGIVVAIKCAEWCGVFTPSATLILTAFAVSVLSALPVFICLAIQYQKKLLNSLGVRLYRISCDCCSDNTFTILRPIVTPDESAISEGDTEILD